MGFPALAQWFRDNQRALPWREDSCSPWGVMVSEVMLQQTPVARVEPLWHEWMARWSTPSDLANASQADAITAWGRLGYPRRAKRLYDAARVITAQHGGKVPQDLELLLALPGIGDYTARAIRTFAFGIPEPIVDTNIRRVIARAVHGLGEAGPVRQRQDREDVDQELGAISPLDQVDFAKALMELGAVVCTARNPQCATCPLSGHCAWQRAGYPPYQGVKNPRQARYEGSDRQARGVFLGELRHSDIDIPRSFLMGLWLDSAQATRALESLIADGLIQASEDGEELRLAP